MNVIAKNDEHDENHCLFVYLANNIPNIRTYGTLLDVI